VAAEVAVGLPAAPSAGTEKPVLERLRGRPGTGEVFRQPTLSIAITWVLCSARQPLPGAGVV
jgi:hypothetical protein